MNKFCEYKLGDLITFLQTGKTPPTNNSLYFDGNIPFVTPADFKGQKYISSTERKLSELSLSDKKTFIYGENTILITTKGDIGKAVLSKYPIAANDQITGINVDESLIVPDFFYYWLLKNKQLLSYKANKAVIPMLNNKRLRNISLVIPTSIEYQKKIVYLLDLVQSIIDKKIEEVNFLNKFQKSIFLDFFGVDVFNKKSNTVLLSDKKYFEISSGITPDRNNEKYFNGNILWVKSGDLDDDFVSDTEEKITQFAIENVGAKIFKKNSIIIAMYGQGKTRGRVGLLTKEASCNQACAVIFSKKISSVYLFSYFQYSYEYIRSLGRGGNRNNLSLAILKNIQIPIPAPPLENKYEKIFKKIYSIKTIHKQSIELIKNLFDSILQSAFEKNTEINEEPIFKELINQLKLEDLKGNKKRLQYLINLFDENKFEDDKSYSSAKEKLFELILENEIEQTFDENEIKLKVKKHETS